MTQKEELARALGAKSDYHLTDERLAILISETTCDVEACPGSGKTTTLSLKAALEMLQFDNPRRALLTLSHTNVARAEIERKATAIPEAQRILRPPHFIGTIQAFVNRFLALPFLRSNGMHVQRVDNDSAAALHLRLVSSNRYRTARFALAKRGDWDVADLELGAEEGTVAFNGTPLSMSRDTPTYRELVSLKDDSMDCSRIAITSPQARVAKRPPYGALV
jgi:DNA helicase-2/ATP-dependent DNA helicase PcrA